MAASPWITFLSDYGLEDSFVGVCKGVIARIAPEARVIDVCHDVAPQDVEHGAIQLAGALPYLPQGVHLVMVDPIRRQPVRGVALRTREGSILLSPDNGVTSLAWPLVGGVEAAYELSSPDWFLPTPSRTFRGRDVFAPVAAHLVAGWPLEQVGRPVDPAELVQLSVRRAAVDDDHVHGEIRAVDHFGNLMLNVRRADLEAAGITLGDTVEVRCAGRTVQAPFTTSYGAVQPGRVALCEDSLRTISVGVNLGNAASTLRARRGEALVISQAPRRAATPTTPVGMFDQPPSAGTA